MKHRRIVITHYGGPEELRIVEEESPEPKPGEVRGTIGFRPFRQSSSLSRNCHLWAVHCGRLAFPWPQTGGPLQHQWLKRLRPALFRQDLIALFDLLRQGKIKPLIAQRLPLAEARQAHELLGKGGVTGKIVLICNHSEAG